MLEAIGSEERAEVEDTAGPRDQEAPETFRRCVKGVARGLDGPAAERGLASTASPRSTPGAKDQ